MDNRGQFPDAPLAVEQQGKDRTGEERRSCNDERRCEPLGVDRMLRDGKESDCARRPTGTDISQPEPVCIGEESDMVVSVWEGRSDALPFKIMYWLAMPCEVDRRPESARSISCTAHEAASMNPTALKWTGPLTQVAALSPNLGASACAPNAPAMIPLEAVHSQADLGQQSAKVRESRGSISLLMGAMTDEAMTEERTEQGAGFPSQGSRSREDGHIVLRVVVFVLDLSARCEGMEEGSSSTITPSRSQAEVWTDHRGALAAETWENDRFRWHIKLFLFGCTESAVPSRWRAKQPLPERSA